MAQEITRRNTEFAGKCKADFTALGRRHPLESARLWVAMTAEAALIELPRGSKVGSVRAALEDFLA